MHLTDYLDSTVKDFLLLQVNTKSLEDIVRRYLSLAEEKTDEARKESHQSVVDVDDLDILQTPEK